MPKLDFGEGIDPSALPPEDTTPMDPRSRLRDAFAQMIMRQREEAVPAQALWQAQAMQQGLAKPPPGPGAPDLRAMQNGAAPMPPTRSQSADLVFPTAPAAPENMVQGAPSAKEDMRNRHEMKQKLETAEKGLFGGKGQFAGPYQPQSAYSLPKKEKKGAKRG